MKNDLRFGMLQPQNVELENVVLGACLLVKDAYDTTAEILNENAFYTDANQRIFKSMTALANKNMPIDLMTVANELTVSGELEKVGGVYGLSKLTNSVVSSANIQTHCRIILQKFIKREIIKSCNDILTNAYDEGQDVFDILDNAEETILKIGSSHVHGDMIPMNQVLASAVRKIEQWRENDGTLTGVPSGFPELDRATRGWQPGDLIIIGARPSVGKTALALNLVRNAALSHERKTTVAIWSLEMKAVYLALRMLAAESEILLHRLQTGRLDDHHMKDLIKKGVDKLKLANVFFDDNTKLSLGLLRSKARKLKKKNQLGLIVIDYIQLMSGEENKGNREQEVAKISRGLKNLAQELDIPVIALSQLSRESDKGVGWGRAPTVSALRESGSIEQDADVIILLWGPTEEEVKSDASLDGKRKIRIGKQRNGMLLTMEVDFKNEIQLFSCIDNNMVPSFRPVNNYYEPKQTEPDPF